MMSFAMNVKQFLCAPSTESLSETEAAVSQIMRQLTDFILFQMQSSEAGITARSISKFCAGVRLIFDVIFGELLEFQEEITTMTIDQFVNVRLLQYFAQKSPFSQEIMQDMDTLMVSSSVALSRALDPEDVRDFVELFKIPIVKFTQFDGGVQIYTQSQILMDRSLLDLYDYVFTSPPSEVFQLALKVFVRLHMWPNDQNSPRVLILRPTAYVGVLNILVPANVGTLHIQCASTINQTFGVEHILDKIQQLQEFRLCCDQYDIQREL